MFLHLNMIKIITVDKNFVSDIEGYQSSSDGKKVIKIGTCGSADTI